MSALHSLPGSPIYAAIFTSSHTHLPGHTHMPRPSNEQREIRRRSADGYRAPRALKEDDDSTTALCAAVSEYIGLCGKAESRALERQTLAQTSIAMLVQLFGYAKPIVVLPAPTACMTSDDLCRTIVPNKEFIWEKNHHLIFS